MGRLRAEHLWLAGFGLTFAALALIYRDSYQQDGGTHFLGARWAWKHPDMFVDVWGRPLFTFVYAFPALFGYAAAKLLTVGVACASAWLTFKVAQRLGVEWPSAVIPLVLLQPSYFLIASDTMTEPLFACILAGALLAQASGRVRMALIVISLLPIVRPEGFFIAPFWAIYVLAQDRRHLPWIPMLGIGTAAWWLAALAITGDPLWIVHNWPPTWQGASPYLGATTLAHRAMSYVARLPEIAGPFTMFLVPIGLYVCLRKRAWLAAGLFLFLLVLHGALWTAGKFGTAGYPRYLVCVAPALALVMLEGWGLLARRVGRWATPLACASVAVSACFCLLYVDACVYTRDGRAVEDAVAELRKQPVKIDRLVWSQAYMCILLDQDPRGREPMPELRTRLRDLPSRTLIFWDGETGPAWYGVGPADFAQAGFRKLFSRDYELTGILSRRTFFGYGGVRKQSMHLYYRD